MKILKGLGTFLLSLLAFIFIFLLSLSFIFKNVVQKGVIGSVVKNIIVEEFSSNEKLTSEDKENIKKINDVIETDDINNLVNKVLKEYENSLEQEDYVVSSDTVDYVVDLLVEYKDLISDITKENISEKEIRSTETRKGIEEAFNEILDETPEGNEDAIRIALTSYNFFVSSAFRLLMIFLAVVCFILIAFIKQSIFKWMKSAGSVLITTGILVSTLYFGIMFAFKQINNSAKYTFIINPTPIVIIGIIEVVIGIVFIITNIITSGKKDK